MTFRIILGLVSPPQSCSNSPSVPVTSLAALNLASFAPSPTFKPRNLPGDEVEQPHKPDGSSKSGSMPRSRSCSLTSSSSSSLSDPPELVAKVTAMLDAGMITPLGIEEEKEADVDMSEKEGETVVSSEKEEETAVSSEEEKAVSSPERKGDEGKVSMQEEGEMEVSEEQEDEGDSSVQEEGEADVAEKQGEEDVSMQEEGEVDASEEEGEVDASEEEKEGDSSYEEEDSESSIIADNKSVAGSAEDGKGEPMGGVESNHLPPESSDNQAGDAMDIDPAEPVKPTPPRRSARNASLEDKVYTESVALEKETKTKRNPKVRSQPKSTLRLLLDVSLQMLIVAN